jgi:hypothetical protein
MYRFASLLMFGLLGTACAGNRAGMKLQAGMPRSSELGPALDAARWAAPIVDTIVVRTAHLELRQGQVVTLSQVIGATGRTDDGRPVAGFFPIFLLQSGAGVVELTDWGLLAIGRGEAALLVIPFRFRRDRAVVTRVPVTVR